VLRTLLVPAIVLGALCAGCLPNLDEMKPQGPVSHIGEVRHVVLFKFKDTATPEQIAVIEDAFRALGRKIPQIVDLEWGTDMSVENLTEGYTHCFLVTFKTAQDRDIYLPHPEHKAFGAKLKPILDKVLVIDYAARE